MSEFSDSFHLRTTDQKDAVALLRNAKVPGYVFPPGNGLVTFVCPRDADTLGAILAANAGLLIHYQFAADHGCSVDVYEGDSKVASLSIDFEEQRAHFERTKFVAKGLLDADAAEALSQWIRGSPDPDARSGRETHVIARKLRLPHFSWLSYHYAQDDDTPPKGRLEVDQNGGTRTIEQSEMEDIEELLATLPPSASPPGKPSATPKKPSPKRKPPKRKPPKRKG